MKVMFWSNKSRSKAKTTLVTCLIIFLGTFWVFAMQGQPHQNASKPTYLLKDLVQLRIDSPEQFYEISLQIRGQQALFGEEEPDFYTQLASYFHTRGFFDSSLWALSQVKSMLKPSDKERMIPILLSIGSMHFFNNAFDSVAIYYKELVPLVDKGSTYEAHFFFLEALDYYLKADYSSAVEALLKSVSLFEKAEDVEFLGVAYHNLSDNYYRLGNKALQLYYAQKALAKHRETGNTYQLAHTLNNLGSYYNSIQELDSALLQYDLAYKEIEQLNSVYLMAQNLTNRANIYEKKGDLASAEHLFKTCEELSAENDIYYGVMLSALNLGNLYRQMKAYDTAFAKLKQAEDWANLLQTRREQALIYQRMAWLARDRGDFAEAYTMNVRYHALNDSIVNERVRMEANELQEKYESERKENQILLLSKQKLSQQLIIVLLVLAVGILIILTQWFRSKHLLARSRYEASQRINSINEANLKEREKDLMDQILEKMVLEKNLDELMDKINGKGHDDMLKKLEAIKNKQSPLDNMLEKYRTLHPEFIKALLDRYPDLTKNDLEFCSLLRMNMSTKEIALLMNIKADSVFTKKYRLVKKMNLPKDTDFFLWLSNI